jgi:hypothetical protein
MLRTGHRVSPVSISICTATGAAFAGLPVWIYPGAPDPVVAASRRAEAGQTSREAGVNLTSDQQIFWQHGFVKLNGTIVTTWAMMIAMSFGAKLITRRLATEGTISRWQILTGNHRHRIEKQIKSVGLE